VPREGDSFESSFGYSFFGTYYNDLTSFNITDHMVNGSFAYRTVLFNLPAQSPSPTHGTCLYLRETEFLRRNTVTLSGVLVEKEPGASDTLGDAVRNMGHLTQSFFRFQNKEFFQSNPLPIDDEFRDANNYTMGILHLLRFAGDKHLVKAGYQVDWEDAQAATTATSATASWPVCSTRSICRQRCARTGTRRRSCGCPTTSTSTCATTATRTPCCRPRPGQEMAAGRGVQQYGSREAPFEGPRILGEADQDVAGARLPEHRRELQPRRLQLHPQRLLAHADLVLLTETR